MFSPQKAAEKANVTRKTVMNAIKALKLKAHRNNENNWVIHSEDLDQWIAEREKQGETPPTETTTPVPPVPPSETTTPLSPPITTQVPPPSPTPEAELKLQLNQLELRHVQEKLELSNKEVARLRSEVSELKAEVREARSQTTEAFSLLTRVIGVLDRVRATPPVPVVDDKASTTEDKPFLLSQDMRVQDTPGHADDGEAEEAPTSENLFNNGEEDTGNNDNLSVKAFLKVLSKVNSAPDKP